MKIYKKDGQWHMVEQDNHEVFENLIGALNVFCAKSKTKKSEGE